MARHIQEKLKSLIHEVQHAIQVREEFAVGESPDSENRNQSAGEIEADDVKERQSMSKEERLNTFPESMKTNQNADVVFWENSKSNEYGDVNIDEDMGIRYNDDRLYDKSRKSNTRRTAIQSNGNQQIEGEILLKGLKDL